MTKLFQINEDDLATLERELPRILDETMQSGISSRLRIKWRTVQEIITRVRWEYGPPIHVEKIDGDAPRPVKKTCPLCDGRRYVHEEDCLIDQCPRCKGTGEVDSD